MKNKAVMIATAAVFLLAVVLSVRMLLPSEHQTVEIVQDGIVIRTIDLANAKDTAFRIESPDGKSYNLVTVSEGRIKVSEAGCPDQTCVHMGALKSDSMPIVCLPNKLIIRFAEGDAS